MSKVVFIIFFISFFLTPIGVDFLSQHFTLCYPNMAHSEYVVPLPRPCRRHQQEVIYICKAKILSPLDALIKIPVFVCQTYTTAWSTIFWFLQQQNLRLFYFSRSTSPPTSLPFLVTNISSNRDRSSD